MRLRAGLSRVHLPGDTNSGPFPLWCGFFTRDRSTTPLKIWPILLLSLLPFAAQAIEIGDPVPSWSLLDQFDQPYAMDSQKTQTILVASSMSAGKIMEKALKDKPKGFLEARRTVFIADIKPMPAYVTRFFAVPKMRKVYSYRVALDREAEIAPGYGGNPAGVQWLQLKDGKLVERREFNGPDALREALETP
jgi:hypothetical protein